MTDEEQEDAGLSCYIDWKKYRYIYYIIWIKLSSIQKYWYKNKQVYNKTFS